MADRDVASSPPSSTGFPIAELTNAFVAFLFAASAPVAIILSAGAKGGLSQLDIASWIFAAFAINGVLTIAMSVIYRQPLAFFWTIPGTVLVASALQHLSFAEVIGAYFLTAALILALGLTGWVKIVMDRIPMPIVMGMVAGVFLSFGLDWIRSFASDSWLVIAMTVTFFALSIFPLVQKRFPPMIGVLIVGLFVLTMSGRTPDMAGMTFATAIARPQLYTPVFSWPAAFELVIPLTITVVAVYTPQGVALLRSAGHQPPVNAITNACGIFSAVAACFGCVSTCLTGPSSAILASSEARHRHWIAGISLGVLAILFGVFSPLVTQALLATPPAFVATLAGLALLRILQGAFQTAFQKQFSLGALVAFLVTLGGLPIFGIGAPFWGIVFGVAASLALERSDFSAKPDS
ncbi:MAG: benzoate/H(+) symporter BenE family transporter [Mesorhizobium sp.]